MTSRLKYLNYALSGLVIFTLSGPIAQANIIPGNAVQLRLSQLIDSNCDGTPNRNSADRDALPGACIIYRIAIFNHSGQSLHAIKINGRIPRYTELFKTYQQMLPSDSAPAKTKHLPSNIVHTSSGQPLLSTRLDYLPAGAPYPVVLQYMVRLL